MKRYTRRSFLSTGVRTGVSTSVYTTGTLARLSAMGVVSRPLLATITADPEPIPPIQDPRIKELAQRGLDAATHAGANYADIRLTYTRERSFRNERVARTEQEVIHVGVRALVNGYWGFAASPLWHPDEMVRLGRESVLQAKVNALGQTRDVDLSPIEGVREGSWETPVRIDAFGVHPQEVRDYILGVAEQLKNEVAKLEPFGLKSGVAGVVACSFWSQEKAFGSTTGQYYTQRFQRTGGSAAARNLKKPPDDLFGHSGAVLEYAGGGWENILDAPIVETVRQSLLEYREMSKLPLKPLDVGRYTTVFDARSMSRLVSRSIGVATEIDRALGYEANAGGTSYLKEPNEMLGALAIGTPLLNVTANRDEPQGLATSQWDDEGVVPRRLSLVEHGILKNFHTSREGAGWLREASERLGDAVGSGGYMSAQTALDAQLIQPGNLVLHPGSAETSHRDLEAGIDRGMSVIGLSPTMDFQMTGGSGSKFLCFELKQGERVARIDNPGILFRTSEIWKQLITIGGPTSAERFAELTTKGEPEQSAFHTTTAVPAVVKEISFFDPMRR